MKKTKRLDGKEILIKLTSRLESDMMSFCREKGIKSQSEFVRQAIAKYIYSDYSDETLKLQGVGKLQANIKELRDMMECFYKYLRLMHINILAYHPELESEYADAAFNSATNRHNNKFFPAYQDSLKNDPPFFEALLHKYFTGDNIGQN